MAVLKNTFEGGSAGTTITVGNSGGASGDPFDVVTGGSGTARVYASDQARRTLSGKFTSGATAANSYAGFSFDPVADTYGRVYVYFPSNPGSGGTGIVVFRGASGNLGWVSIGATGTLTLRNTSGSVIGTSLALSTATWYRLEYHFVRSATVGEIHVQVYAGDSATLLGQVDATGANTGDTDCDTVWFGIGVNTASATMYVDNIVAGAADWPGPVDTTAPSTPTGLSVSGVTQTAATLSWTAATDNVAVTGYNLYAAATPATPAFVHQVGAAALSYTFTGLNAGTGYTLAVSAIDADGNESSEATTAATTAAAAVGVKDLAGNPLETIAGPVVATNANDPTAPAETVPYYPSETLFPGVDVYPGQPVDPLHLLYVSFDDLDVPIEDATWVDLSGRLLSFDVASGRDSELDDLDAGQATWVLRDPDRALDPSNASSAHAPNVVPNRRVWHRIQTASHTYDVFKGYVDGWGPSWTDDHGLIPQAVLRASDGRKVLSTDAFPAASPDVEDYEDVVQADDPSFYYRLGEPKGTKMAAHTRWIKKHGKKKRKRFKVRETRAPVTGVSGPSGTYKNTPLLGQPGAIAGDTDTAVRFRASESEWARIVLPDPSDLALDTSNLTSGDTVELAISCWVNVASFPSSGDAVIVAGPYDSSVGAHVWALYLTTAGRVRCGTLSGLGVNASISAGSWHHIGANIVVTVGEIGDVQITLAIDGAVKSSTSSFFVPSASPDSLLRIGRNSATGGEYLDATVDEVAIYEHALDTSRFTAHYQAGSYGLARATTGKRIWDILSTVGEWPVWNVQAGQRNMPPGRTAGLQPSDLVDEAVAGEGMPAIFYFDRAGTPTFLDSDHRSNPPYTANLYVFGRDTGQLPYQQLALNDSDAFLYNDIRATREQGDKTFQATDTASIEKYGRLVLTLDNLPHDNDADTQDYVDQILARYKDPNVRIQAITMVGTSPDQRDAILSLDLGDPVQVTLQDRDGNTVLDQSSYVERRHITGEPDVPLIGEFSISPR